ncbi:MAG: tetratricopeptide repeat protein [Pseudomonadota bacterium]
MTERALVNALSSGDWSKAERILRRATAKRSATAGDHYNLGKVLLEQDKAAAAIISFRKAIALKTDYQSAWFELGRAALRRRDYAVAEDAFSKAAALNPSDRDAKLNLARVAIRRGSWEAARVALDGAIGPEAAALRYRALAETRSPNAAPALAAMLADRAARPHGLRAMVRTSKGRIPLTSPRAV